MGAAEPTSSLTPWAAAEALGATAAELAAFQDEPPQMNSGAVGKNGFLHLGFEQRGGGTILADLDDRAPYRAQRALYCDPDMPDLAWVFVITTSGCVLQGDRLALEVALGPLARAHVTTQSATKIHTMDANYAVQTQTHHACRRRLSGASARSVDPASACALFERHAHLDCADRNLLYSEIVQPGRKHHHPDECFGATLLSLATHAVRPDAQMLFSEKLVIEPARRPVRQTGVMDGFDVFGNVILLTPADAADRIHARVDADVDLKDGVAFGACRLPNDAGLIYKVLGRETAQVKAKVREFWGVVREEVTGAAIPAPFFWR